MQRRHTLQEVPAFGAELDVSIGCIRSVPHLQAEQAIIIKLADDMLTLIPAHGLTR